MDGDGGGFDFSSVTADATADVHALETTSAGGQPPAAPAGASAPASAAAPATAQPTGQTTQGGEPLYEVKANGRTFRVPLSELQSGYSRTADYTQKTMALAERERQWADYVQKLENAYSVARQRLEDPRVSAYLQSLEAQARPNEPLTWEQQQQLLQQTRQQMEQQFQQRTNAIAEDTQVTALATVYNADLENTVTRVLESQQFGLIKDIPGIKDVLWNTMRDRQPGTIQEAKKYLVEAATQVQQTLLSKFAEHQKTGAAQAAQQLSGIERPGGTAPPPVPQQPGWKLGDKGLREAAIADVLATMK